RGFLGYDLTIEMDSGTGRRVETTRSQEYPHFGRVTDIKTLVSGTVIRHHVRTLGPISNFEGRSVSALVTEIISNSGLDGQWQSDRVDYLYDSYGNISTYSYAKD